MDRVCGECDTCPVTKTFTAYVDVMNKVCGHNGREIWKSGEISSLKEEIKEFKRIGLSTFRFYQKSGMGTVKWNLLDHIPDDIVRNGGLYLCEAG